MNNHEKTIQQKGKQRKKGSKGYLLRMGGVVGGQAAAGVFWGALARFVLREGMSGHAKAGHARRGEAQW